jgi:hypothetical protein
VERGGRRDRLGSDRGPHVALGVGHAAVPRRPDQQVDPGGALHGQEIVDIGFAVAHADKAGLGTGPPGSQDGLDARQPLLAFFLGNGPLLPRGPLADVVWVAGPHLLGEHPQRHPFRGKRQGGVHEQSPMGRVSQGAQAGGGRVRGPVQLGRILHSQDQRHGGQAGESGANMAVQEILGRDGRVVEEAIGRLSMASSPHAAGSDAPGCWAKTVARAIKRWVRRASPSSASANSVTAQASSLAGGDIAYSLWDLLALLVFCRPGYQKCHKTKKCVQRSADGPGEIPKHYPQASGTRPVRLTP